MPRPSRCMKRSWPRSRPSTRSRWTSWPAKNKAEGEAFLAKNKSAAGVKTTASGLQYQVISQGTGARPGPNDTVEINYTGSFVDGQVFDASAKHPAWWRGEDSAGGGDSGLPRGSAADAGWWSLQAVHPVVAGLRRRAAAADAAERHADLRRDPGEHRPDPGWRGAPTASKRNCVGSSIRQCKERARSDSRPFCFSAGRCPGRCASGG